MATRKPTEPQHAAALPGEPDIARVYRAGGNAVPPPALDAAILAEAQRAVQKPAATKPFHLRWAAPLSTAAVVVLAVGVVLLMSQEGTLNHRTELEAPNEYSAAPASPPLADAREEVQTTAPLKAKRAAPERAESVEGKLARNVPAETMKKAEAPATTMAPAAAPPVLGGAQQGDRLSATRQDRARARSTPAGMADMSAPAADVIGVRVSGAPGAYSFNVTVKSPDTGCQQYADWWEVVSADGKLLYRRVLLHSHVGEQPFTRSGGPVPVQPDAVIWIRAHMNTSGYGGAAFKGSVKAGFKPAVPDAGFAAGLAKQPPLPEGCDF